jgi:outer membrane protein assembly factor BamB
MKCLKTFLVLLLFGATLFAADWPSIGGNAQRDGWSRGEKKLSKQTAAGIRFLYGFKAAGAKGKQSQLTTPVVLSNIITYKGFKQLVSVGRSDNSVVSIDADLGTLFFDTHLTPGETSKKIKASATCPGGMTANLAFPGNSLAPGRFGAPSANRVGRVARSEPAPMHFTFASPLYAISDDGALHTILQLGGNANTVAPLKILPPMARASGLNINNDRIFVATVGNCHSNPNGIYAVDPSAGTVESFLTGGSGAAGSGGTAIGTDGVVYAQIASGHGEVAGDYNDSVLALSPDKLAVQDYFTLAGAAARVDAADVSGVTPTVFGLEQKDWVVAAGHDGRIYILDADSLGGADHHTPAFRSDPIVPPASASKRSGKANGLLNNFATYLDDQGVRWLFASVRGPVIQAFPAKNGDAPTGSAPNGSIVAFKITFDGGKPSLTPVWRSRDMVSPAAPAIMNDLVVSLSTGEPTSSKKGDRAILYVLDARTGKELYVGDKATAYSSGGLAVANSQIYFATHDGTLYAYGIPLER